MTLGHSVYFHVSNHIHLTTYKSPPVALHQLIIDDMFPFPLIPMYTNHLSVMLVSALTSSTQDVYHCLL